MQRNLWEQYKDAFRHSNNGLIQLILINGTVFLALHAVILIFVFSGLIQFGQGDALIREYLGLPSDTAHLLVRPWTFVTTFFTHHGLWHIAMNMLMLYWFGSLVKEYLGNNTLVNLYILGGIAGGLLYLLVVNLSPGFAGVNFNLIGASASVLAIVVGAATLMPNHQFSLILLGPVKLKYIALVLVILAVIGSAGANAGGEIAHLGGAAIGFFYIKQLQKGNDLGGWLQSTLSFLRSFFVRPKVKVTHRGTSKRKATNTKKSSSTTTSGVPQDEIDAILDKISEKGYESLTKDEKQKLFNASNK